MKQVVAFLKGPVAVLGGVWLASGPLAAAEQLLSPVAAGLVTTAAGNSAAPRVSADGRWVVFTSEAGDLTPGDGNNSADVFLRDRQTGTTLLVSRRDAGGASAAGVSLAPDLTPDGRYVAFQSTASDLVPEGWFPPTTNGWRSLIYRFDRQTGEMRLINVNRPAPVPNPWSLDSLTNLVRDLIQPCISADGQRVLFSTGRNRFALVDGDPATPEHPDALFLWDAATEVTEYVSERHRPSLVEEPAHFYGQQIDDAPLMSGDGRYVAFATAGDPFRVAGTEVQLDRMNVIVRDRALGTNMVPNYVHEGNAFMSAYSLLGGVSEDGQYLLYERRGSLTGESFQQSAYFGDNLWLHHLPTGQFICVSTNATTGQIGNATSERGALSADGNWAAYFSKASNLVADDTNGRADVFLYSRLGGANTRISTHPAWQGVRGRRVEQAPKLTPDGRFVLYQATGSGLFRFDRVTGTNALITVDVETDSPDFSSDGRFVVFTARPSAIDPTDPNPHRQVYCHDFETGLTELISVRDPAVPAATPNGASSLELAAVSATGRFIAFTSYADNVGEGGDRTGRLWVRDTQLGTNILVSVDQNGEPLITVHALRSVQMSDDGRWVSFVSGDPNLVTGDSNGEEDVFLRDLHSGATRLVSRLATGNSPPSARSHSPAFSRDGSVLIFKSDGSGIASGGWFYDLYAHSVAENTNRIATWPISGMGGPSVDGPCDLPVVSPNGRWLLFRSQAFNIHRETTAGSFYRLVLKDLSLQFGNHFVEAQRINLDAQNQPLPGDQPGDWAFSADSEWLAFNHWNPTTSGVYRRRSAIGPVELVTTNGFYPLIANGGNIVAWQSRMPAAGYTDTNATWDVFHHRVAEGVTRVVSLDQSGAQTGNGASRLIALSADGRYVLFRSHASSLVAGDDNRSLDLFLRDTVTDVTVLLSRSSSSSATANNFSGKAVFTDDGTKIIFESYASDLVAGDFNLERDIFVAQLQLPDSDDDGLSDDWELTYFNTLDLAGVEDSDGDGLSDLAEFRAGTSPLNSASVLRAIAVTGVGSGTTTVMWSAVPGRVYQVQSRDAFSEVGWDDVGDPVTATSTSGSTVDPAPGEPDRFYRVLVIE